ncbi:pyruvate kinase, partial [Patescibacteria group bacterium]
GISIGILIDLQGPEIRIQTINGMAIKVKKNQQLTFVDSFTGTDDLVCIPYGPLFEAVSKGDQFAVEDGSIFFKVTKKRGSRFWAKALGSGTLKDKKGMNLIGKDINLPSLIKEDIEKLDLATRQKVDYIALSFTRQRQDLQMLKKAMDQKQIDAQIIAKVESQKALDNIDEIITEADGIMIGRGDLGIEVPIEQLAFHQKMIVRKCREQKRPVIVATQMLESMTTKPYPTRAEATDVANAVFDGTDAVMLSAETAMGKYPVETVQAMSRILKFNEKQAQIPLPKMGSRNETASIVQAAYQISRNSQQFDLSKVVVMTETGRTARLLSALRPSLPTVVVTHHQKTVEILTLAYGLYPVKIKFPTGKLSNPEVVFAPLKQRGYLKKGEKVLLIHGYHWQKPGQTNALVIRKVE